jgi:hypothetical protein
MKSDRIFVALFAVYVCPTNLYAAAATSERGAAEDTVRKYEHACEVFDFATANSLLIQDARWIEDSYPEAAKFTGEGWSKHWQEMKDTKAQLHYQIRDLVTHIRGEVGFG